MKKSLLSRLRSNGIGYIISALLLLVGIPLYQEAILAPQGYSAVFSMGGAQRFGAYLAWINGHVAAFLLYRALLIVAFALIFTLPYSLYRIIVAQELMAREDEREEQDDAEQPESAGLPLDAWRGKGFAIIAIWAGVLGLALYLLGTAASTIYLVVSNPGGVASVLALSTTFTIIASAVGIGLVALSTLFFGAFIVRSGLNLWPAIWVAFGYMSLGLTPLLTGSAVAVASAPGESQSFLTSVATLLFALWILWFGIMLVRLQPE